MAELLYKATTPEGEAAGQGAADGAGAGAGQNGSAPGGPAPDDVIDAEFKESQ
jgi:hypothetical protein